MTLLQHVIEIVRYRELVRNLVLRDLKVRYKNSVLGFLWSLLNPLLMMIVFTFVFTVMMPNNTITKFPVFVLCALLPWTWFTTSINGATNCIVGNAQLIKKVYFPRVVLPISVVLSNLVNFLLALIVLFTIMVLFQINLTGWVLLLPVIILIQFLFTLGLALVLGTINVFYRDTGVIMEVVLLAWFFLTPIFYPIDILPAHRLLFGFDLDVHRLIYVFNPMASLIATYRVILYTGAPPAFDFLARTVITSLFMLVLGYFLFNRYSRVFGEEV
jgi:lipopolysaccharide transport system permease protein